MLIDWFTVAAQTVNFLLLIWLLHRFLYGPILKAMDRREARIEARLQEARQEQQTARKEVAKYQRLNEELEENRVQRLQEAAEEAARHRKQLVEQGRTEASALAEAWKEAVRRDRERFMVELKKRLGHEVLQIARKSLSDLTGFDLASLLVQRLNERLSAMDESRKTACISAAEKSGVLVRSAVALDEEIRHTLESGLRQVLGEDTTIDYAVEEDMALGIELSLGALKLSWGIDSYFSELEQQLELQLEDVGQATGDSGGAA